MELVRGLHNLPASHRGCVLTIGNFDGVHRGHQALIARTVELSREHGVPPWLLTFEPTPREFFAPENRPGRISSLREKLDALRAAGIKGVMVQRFDRAFSSIEAKDFIEHILLERLRIKTIVVGDDFRFGARRQGDIAMLREHGFAVASVASVMIEEGQRCSSTRVRRALAVSDLAQAARLLGRPYGMCGRVRRGLQLGRTLDMPTANINLLRKPALRMGIYAVHAQVAGRNWNGVASLGVRPTLGLTQCLLETHVFGNPGDLYGEVMNVEFVQHLRDERRFENLDALARQMQLDKAQAVDLLGVEPS